MLFTTELKHLEVRLQEAADEYKRLKFIRSRHVEPPSRLIIQLAEARARYNTLTNLINSIKKEIK